MDGNPVAIACEEVVAFLRREGIYEHEAAHLRELNSRGEHRELLELAERYGNCMAFLDHMALTHKLSAAWNAVCDRLNLEKKQVVRKLRVLGADKNADPEAVENYRARREKLQEDLAVVNLTCIRMEKLKEIPVDYDMEFPDEMLLPEADRALLLGLDNDGDNDDGNDDGGGDNGDHGGDGSSSHDRGKQASAEEVLQTEIPGADHHAPE